MADLNPAGEAAAAELNAKFGAGTAVFQRTDVADDAQVEALFATALAKFGRVDIVANNAGLGEASDFYSDETRKGWRTQLSVNLQPVILGTQMAIHQAKKDNRDVVVLNTASLAGLYPQSGSPIYVGDMDLGNHSCIAS